MIAVEKYCLMKPKSMGLLISRTDELLTIPRYLKNQRQMSAFQSWHRGRYILMPRIFAHLETTGKGSFGEIQLTDAIAKLLQDEEVHAYQFRGKRYDCGSKLGYLEATVAYALKHPELADDFKRSLENLVA